MPRWLLVCFSPKSPGSAEANQLLSCAATLTRIAAAFVRPPYVGGRHCAQCVKCPAAARLPTVRPPPRLGRRERYTTRAGCTRQR